MRPLLVGELNPYGSGPGCALWPLPEHASGGRLQRILGLTRGQYLRGFDRMNLCTGKWSLSAARVVASRALEEREDGALVLLGAKVCSAFSVHFVPFARVGRIFVLPHPSGRNLIWNDPDSAQRARGLLAEVLG